MVDVKRINTVAQLRELQQELKVRPDWHEPDEQDVTARVFGFSFDNAGFWGTNIKVTHLPETERGRRAFNFFNTSKELARREDSEEMYVAIYVEGVRVAEINLATLFAFACGTYEG